MRIIFILIFLSSSYCFAQAQAKYIWGKNESGKSGWYVVTALTPPSTVQTSLRNKSDSIKSLYALVKRVTDLEKLNRILRDSIKLLSKPDTTWFGNVKGRGIKSDPYIIK